MKQEKQRSSPKWASKSLSSELQKLIPKGESQFLDFKEKLERNESMAKEIASFATSNDGMITLLL